MQEAYMTTAEMDRTVVKQAGNIVSHMGEDIVMLNIQHGKYYNLGRVGGRIWELLEQPMTIRQIVTRLMSEYHVSQDRCESEVYSFLNQLYKERLVDFAEGEEDEPTR